MADRAKARPGRPGPWHTSPCHPDETSSIPGAFLLQGCGAGLFGSAGRRRDRAPFSPHFSPDYTARARERVPHDFSPGCVGRSPGLLSGPSQKESAVRTNPFKVGKPPPIKAFLWSAWPDTQRSARSTGAFLVTAGTCRLQRAGCSKLCWAGPGDLSAAWAVRGGLAAGYVVAGPRPARPQSSPQSLCGKLCARRVRNARERWRRHVASPVLDAGSRWWSQLPLCWRRREPSCRLGLGGINRKPRRKDGTSLDRGAVTRRPEGGLRDRLAPLAIG
jgi:hypothetical protein